MHVNDYCQEYDHQAESFLLSYQWNHVDLPRK